MLERCRKTLQYHQVACYHNLPITNLSGHALESLSSHRLYARLPKQPENYLVVIVIIIIIIIILRTMFILLHSSRQTILWSPDAVGVRCIKGEGKVHLM